MALSYLPDGAHGALYGVDLEGGCVVKVGGPDQGALLGPRLSLTVVNAARWQGEVNGI